MLSWRLSPRPVLRKRRACIHTHRVSRDAWPGKGRANICEIRRLVVHLKSTLVESDRFKGFKVCMCWPTSDGDSCSIIFKRIRQRNNRKQVYSEARSSGRPNGSIHSRLDAWSSSSASHNSICEDTICLCLRTWMWFAIQNTLTKV